MTPNSSKAKQFLIVAAKLSIVAGAFYFIYSRLADDDFDWEVFSARLNEKLTVSNILLLLLLSFLNRFFEILKWQNLVSWIKRISFGEATNQVLSALTVSIFTPGGIGEYGAKALFFPKNSARKIVFLNLISNGVQMILTVVFGIFGLLYFNAQYGVITTKTVAVLFGTFLVTTILSFVIKRFSIKGYSLEKLAKKIKVLPKEIHHRNIVLATFRYLAFSHQYFLLFLIFDVHIPYLTLMAAITGVYFLATAIPTFQFLDFAVKGSVAVYFFGLMGVNEWIPVLVTTLMWILNVVLPVIIGSYYIMRFKSQWKH